MNVAEHLSQVPLLRGLDRPDIEKLAKLTRPVRFPAGTKIIEIGESGRSLFLIVEGQVTVVYPARNNDVELARLGVGDFFGEMALLNERPRSATVQAVDEVSLLVLDKADFRNVVERSPAVALQLLETLSVRIRNADEQISSLSDKAMKDPLTGLLNRRAFNERIKTEIDRAVRYDEVFALILIDLDHFKRVNDTYGHDVGDVVLSWIGRLLGEHTRSADTPFRLGGEEFAILAPATPPETAYMVSQRLVDVVAEARPPVDVEMQVTMSCGYSCCPQHSASADLLYQIGDRALLRAKEEGRNRVCRPIVEGSST